MTVTLSEKHGLNPSISICFFCGGEKNELIIPGRLLVIRDEDARNIFKVDPAKTRFFFLEESAVTMVFGETANA